MVLVPGAMESGLDSVLFWGSLSFSLVVAGAFAVPVNRWLIARGKGHAVVHETGIHGGPPVRVVAYAAAVAGTFGSRGPARRGAAMSETTPRAHGYTENKDAVIKRLRRIEGQVRGVERMVEENRYCIDVVTQVTAIQAALDKVALELLSDHAAHCVIGAEER